MDMASLFSIKLSRKFNRSIPLKAV